MTDDGYCPILGPDCFFLGFVTLRPYLSTANEMQKDVGAMMEHVWKYNKKQEDK